MKSALRKITPTWVKKINKTLPHLFALIARTPYQIYRNIKYSSDSYGKESALSKLMVISHIIEKGITMPDRRLGFGQAMVRMIIHDANKCIKRYGAESAQVQYTLNDLSEYLLIHQENDYVLPEDIVSGISKLTPYIISKEICRTASCSPVEFFKETSDFAEFARSRHSIRNYNANKHIDNNRIKEAVKLAQTAPSACNRQSTRVRVIDNKDLLASVLKLQTGNRGFGHLADKMILITAEQQAWSFDWCTSAYLDAGIFTMNLLYALHYYKIGACTLNAHLKKKEQKKLRKLLELGESEIPVVFIMVGELSDEFLVPKSERLPIDEILKIY